MKLKKSSVIVIGGCTASGKSSLAIELAEKLQNAELLCADSVTLYRHFDIGSAKPEASDRARVPHHLLDIRDGHESFTAGDFVDASVPIIEALHGQHKTPILVGGTGFYLRALLQGMTEQSLEESAHGEVIKKQLEADIKSKGIAKLYEEMLQLDPALKDKIHVQDEYRVIRALQAMRSTGKRWSELNAEAKARPPRYENVHFFCLDVEREVLRERVKARTKKMLKQGLVEETKKLLALGIPAQAKPMQSIGYRQVIELFEGKISVANLADEIELATMRLAKQQRTWFRGEKKAIWVKNLSDILETLVLESGHAK